MTDPFQAFVVSKDGDETSANFVERKLSPLPNGEVTVRVAWSCVNYKDGLATLADGGVVQEWPRVPGVDMSGTVIETRDSRFQEGDEVLCTGFGFGVGRDGAFAKFAQVPADWLMRKPDGLSLRDCMSFGTAGFTAALAIKRMEENGIAPGCGEILVTGASGGVGSMAVAMLARLGHKVVAASGKKSAHGFLTELGAERILSREEVSEKPRPLGKTMWAGAIDQVGGQILAWVLSTMAYRGVCASTGLTAGIGLSSTVFPFILRGVSLLGVDSVMVPMEERGPVWRRMTGELRPRNLDRLTTEIAFTDLPGTLAEILVGKVTGRTVVRIGE